MPPPYSFIGLAASFISWPILVMVVNCSNTWIYTTSKADPEKVRNVEKEGVQVTVLDADELQVRDVLLHLADRGIASVFVEGGATVQPYSFIGLAASFISWPILVMVVNCSKGTSFID